MWASSWVSRSNLRSISRCSPTTSAMSSEIVTCRHGKEALTESTLLDSFLRVGKERKSFDDGEDIVRMDQKYLGTNFEAFKEVRIQGGSLGSR